MIGPEVGAGAEEADFDVVADEAVVDGNAQEKVEAEVRMGAEGAEAEAGVLELGAFEEFLNRNPDHELAPDAQYHVARTYQEQGDESRAVDAYQRVTEMYPASGRAPSALLYRGQIEAARGNTAVARRLFQQITTGYPDSPELSLAQRELERLGGQ